jgi:hypothetical protein
MCGLKIVRMKGRGQRSNSFFETRGDLPLHGTLDAIPRQARYASGRFKFDAAEESACLAFRVQVNAENVLRSHPIPPRFK